MLAPGIDSIEGRQSADVEGLVSADGKSNDVAIIMILPKGMREEEVLAVQRGVNNGLAKNGFGRIDDTTQQVIIITDNSPRTVAQEIESIENRRKELGIEGRFIIFAPQSEDNTVNVARDLLSKYPKEGNVTVVPDEYSDFKPQSKQPVYPDVMARVALGRNIAFYQDLLKAGKDTASVEEIISNLLLKITDGKATLDQILNFLKVLHIVPIPWGKEIRDWTIAQKATATAL